jgi:hypothetical protein
MGKRIQAFLGYIWAVGVFFLVLAMFIGNDFFAKGLVSATGLTVSPRFTGGEVARRIDRHDYLTAIHRPVFDGLVAERSTGFIQVDLKKVSEEPFPEIIDERVDYDHNGKIDFQLQVNTRTGRVNLKPLMPSVIKVERIYQLPEGYAVRIILKETK